MEACLGAAADPQEEVDPQESVVGSQGEEADLQEGETQEQMQTSQIFPDLPTASLARNLKSSQEIIPKPMNSSPNGIYLLGSTSTTPL